MAYVIFQSGPRTGEKVMLEGQRTVFGRQPSCDCMLNHPTVSREHFSIERSGGKMLLVDQESGNGTFANGSRVSWVELKDGDSIQAGPFLLVYRSSEEETPGEIASDVADRAGGQAFDASHERIYPRQYLEGILHFNAGRYYDAHEVWEEVWLHSSGEAKLFYQMLIQAAVGLHHYERDNCRGARGMYNNVTEKVGRLPSSFMSLDVADFARRFRSFFSDLIEMGIEAPPAANKPRPVIRLTRASGKGDL